MMLEFAAKLIFWSSVAALFYTYAGYPMLLFLVSTVRPKRVRRGAYQPSVSVIITAYNEERDLKAKLENTLALDYPGELVEIIVASDCSTDRTDEIALQFADRDVRLHRQVKRLGKTAAQNAAVELAHGEIIVFSDATSHYEPNVLRSMMPNFADSSVGCVAGRLIYVDPEDSRVGLGARSYWAYETFLKKHESRAVSLIGASGCMYAVRKSAYVPLYHEACSDFIIATKMVEQGLRTVYEPQAVCIEQTNRGSDKELKMRVRVIAQTFAELWRHRAVINPLNSGFYGVQLFSHKVMRYLVPLFLIAMLTASAVLAKDSPFYAVILAVQLGCYLCAFLSWILEHTGVNSSLLALPQYFVLANVASLVGLYKFLRGERYAVWQPIRQSTAEASKLNETGVTVGMNDNFSLAADHAQTTLTAADSDEEKAPVVSVIIPAYNVAEYIGEALASVFVQTFNDFEVIVINDGSNDTEELERVLQPYLNRIVYIKQQNRGPSGARNAGIRRASGQYVAFLDADDMWLPVYLSEQIHAFASEPKLDLIYGDAMLFSEGDPRGKTFMDTYASIGPVTLASLLSQRCVVITSCVVVRRQTLIDAGLFDENYFRSEDFDLWVRLVYAGARLSYQRKVVARHRLRPGSLAGNHTRMNECAIEVYANLARKLTLTPHERELVGTQVAKYELNLALSSGKRELMSGNYEQAIASLRRALSLKRTLRQGRLKLCLALLALRAAPTVTHGIYLKRNESALSPPPSWPPRKRAAGLEYTIAHVMPWDGVGGTEHATLRIAQATANAHLRHVMFCLPDAPAVNDFFTAAGFETVVYKKIEPSYRHAWSYLWDSYRLARELERREIDLIHCADVPAGFSVGLAARLAHIPMLCHVRNRHGVMSRRDQSFLRTISKFVFVSKDTWRNFAYNVSPHRGVVVYDGIDVSAQDRCWSAREVREEFGIGAEIKIIGMVARVSPQKDYATLAKAAAQVVKANPHVRFLIVGDHTQEETHRLHYEEVKQMLARNGVTSHFIFTGFRKDIVRLVSAMDIFVLSTNFEGLPLVLLEAMAESKPVVATAVDGIPEIVLDGHTGLVYPPQDDAQLAARIVYLLENEPHAAMLGAAARQAVKTHWSKDQFAANMVKQYQSMLDGRKPRRAGSASISLRVITEERLERSK